MTPQDYLELQHWQNSAEGRAYSAMNDLMENIQVLKELSWSFIGHAREDLKNNLRNAVSSIEELGKSL